MGLRKRPRRPWKVDAVLLNINLPLVFIPFKGNEIFRHNVHEQPETGSTSKALMRHFCMFICIYINVNTACE